ncbi:MAG: hypothetical protein PsegKO_08700 [Pseudohongiellaceae bacterium]
MTVARGTHSPYWAASAKFNKVKLAVTRMNTLQSANRRSVQPQLRIIMLLTALALCGCSQQQVYNLLQENQRQRCELQPIPLQPVCAGHYRTPFNEYQRLRESLGSEGDEAG